MSTPLQALPNTYRAFYGSFLGLRPAQRTAIAPILAGRDLLLQAATGSGKTEAVLAPCLERLIQGGRQGAVLYIVPTRALAGDLIRRLTGPLKRLSLTMAVRTGDLKRRGSRHPDLLLTTPESLDVALGSRNDELRALLDRICTVIIDEVHTFAGRPRGMQLHLLLTRLSRRISHPLQRIALSATVADAGAVIAGLGLSAGTVRLSVPGETMPPVRLVHLLDDEDLIALIDDLQQSGSRRMLLFSDSRRRCELRHDLLRSRFGDACLLHYSNLSTQQRQAVEADLRKRRLAICVATSTLELGVDIGDIDTILLDGPPASAAAFLQRIGRAGRRGGGSKIWGLCQGPRADQQLTRFLGLLSMARAGVVERPLSWHFPGVLAQQVASCLYEVRRMSLPALQNLLPDHSDDLAKIVPHLQKKRWLKIDSAGLLVGGYRYHQARFERWIWSNFPPEQQPFTLEVDQESLAELPATLVRQLNAGDRVQLAGRRLLITEILTAERRVLATPTQAPENTTITWAGLSAPISFEAALAARDALRAEDDHATVLTRRTTRLLSEIRDRPLAVLDNGLTAYRLRDGGIRYQTWLGTLGNLILRESIRASEQGGLSMDSDALGVTVDALIDFRSLRLPLRHSDFQAWITAHLRVLRASVPLGAFALLLPDSLQVEELTAYLYDPRLCEALARHTASSGAIESGAEVLSQVLEEAPTPPPAAIPAAGDSLLPPPAALLPPPTGPRRRLTVARLAGWLRTGQCDRHLQWSAYHHPEEAATAATAQRKQHRSAVAAALPTPTIAATDHTDPAGLLSDLIHRGGGTLTGIRLLRDGISGRLDLIMVVADGDAIHLIPGDILTGPAARYAQKWRVALHAWLLQPIADALGARLEEGVLLIRPLQAPLGSAEEDHFPLAPWHPLIPRLLRRARVVEADTNASWRLTGACVGCAFWPICTTEATRSPIHLLPGLRAGTLSRLRHDRINDLAPVSALPSDPMWGGLPGEATAVLKHQITPTPLRERHLPDRTAPLVFLALQTDPHTGDLLGIVLAGVDGTVRRLPDIASLSGALPDEAWLLHYGARLPRILELAGVHLPADLHTGRPLRLDLRALLLSDFRTPLLGTASLWQAGTLLGLSPSLPAPDSLLHAQGGEPAEDRIQVMIALWLWMAPQLHPAARHAGPPPLGGPMLRTLLRFLNRERAMTVTRVRRLQALPLSERVARSVALGPLTLTGQALDDEGHLLHHLQAAGDIQTSRLRPGDFLRLSALGRADPQDGIPVILEHLAPITGQLAIRLRSQRSPHPTLAYSLEADLTDFNHPRLLAISQQVLSQPTHPLTAALFCAAPRLPPDEARWAADWLTGGPPLQARQAEAFRLAFTHRIAVIEGPPGTGKTFLLAWILVAALQRAAEQGSQLRIAVTALTHQAINQLLRRLHDLLDTSGVAAEVFKIGRACDDIQALTASSELVEMPRAVVGGTVYGLSRLFSARPAFDLIAVDEASQLLLPQAWLALACGTNPRILLVGDQHQLGPVVSDRDDDMARAALSHLRDHQASVRLDCSFRLSDGLCEFPSRTWYDNELYPAHPDQRLLLSGGGIDGWCGAALDPNHPTTLLVIEHASRSQHAIEEADAIVTMFTALTSQGVSADDVAILSPHRAQNSLIRARLIAGGVEALPVIDTVERLQGAERDVVILSLIASDPDQLDSTFLNDPRRFNVAITRARLKLVVVASRTLAEAIPRSEAALVGGQHLVRFVAYCRAQGAVVVQGAAPPSTTR